jgi:hypothetical protein
MKASSLELAAVNHIWRENIAILGQKLILPLSVCIEYKGYKILACCALPVIPGETGCKYANYSKDSKGLILQIFQKLEATFNIQLAFDVEGHVLDEFPFVLDCHRLMPAEEPKVQKTCLARLLRPEFVKKWRCPLYADAFLANSDDKKNREVSEATKYLRETEIPKFVSQLKLQSSSIHCQSDLVKIMHQTGINLRYLGIIYDQLEENNSIRQFCLVEMISRTLKDLVYQQWRNKQSVNAENLNEFIYSIEEYLKKKYWQWLNKEPNLENVGYFVL